MVTTSPEGHSKERFSATPATQFASKEVIFETEEAETMADLSLCRSVTCIKQLLALQGEVPSETNKGRDKADSVTVSLELVSFLGGIEIEDD
jgi:hypothetical protein